jgi:hypothetical protein
MVQFEAALAVEKDVMSAEEYAELYDQLEESV